MPYKDIEKQRKWRIAYQERITGKKRKFTRKPKEMSEEYLKERIEKIKKSAKKYTEKNKEKIAEYNKKYAEEHKEKIAGYKERYKLKLKKTRPFYQKYLKYKERMKLYYKVDLSEEDYRKWNRKNKKRLSNTYAKRQRKERIKKEGREGNHPAWVLARDMLSKEEFKEWGRNNRLELGREKRRKGVKFLRDYKLSHPCVRCGEKDPDCLTFHHIDKSAKKYDIHKIKEYPKKTLIKEIEKCEVICVNCHAKLHNDLYKDIDNKIKELTILLKEKLTLLERRKAYRNRQKLIGRQYIQNYKSTHFCQKCDEADDRCLCFHHVNKEEKEGNIPALCKYGMKKLKAEIAKCIILCGNCHSKLHFTIKTSKN